MLKKLKKTMIFILCSISFIYLAIGILLYVKQRELLYVPQAYQQKTYPSINLPVDNETINVIKLTETHKDTVSNPNENTQQKQVKPAIIYFGGNAEAVVYSADIFEPLLARYDVYLVNYRGYGTSTGYITEENNYKDASVIYNHIKKTHSNISVIGRSIGTGVATYLAETNPVNKLVLITPYDSITKVVQAKFPLYPIPLLLKDTYPSVTRAPSIDSEILILSAENDTLIPVSHAENLAEAFTQKVDYQQISEADHNDIMMKRNALEKFWAFLGD